MKMKRVRIFGRPLHFGQNKLGYRGSSWSAELVPPFRYDRGEDGQLGILQVAVIHQGFMGKRGINLASCDGFGEVVG